MKSGFEIVAIDHLVLRVKDIERMLAFYQNTLGCELERVLEDIGLWQLKAGSSLIDLVSIDKELGKRLSGEVDVNKGNLEHLCLQVRCDSLQGLAESLKEAGAEVSDIETRYGAQGFGESFYIDDPEGNTIELKLHLSHPQE